ncbi:general secretion pathway protein GspL [Pigmentiphaga aceris]|uniref:General secretion pathway protein GspL n=1 Tax=Pigmentiphaga aceris TaxID=1940612 RepID=A0A5C0B1B4_9BURK|nr:type II secretion system protein GspL [Pigmentiphaga aceris]QEI08488.1 general secretion pathway protein GspL [Pigmentiphaga aceris]
MRHLLRVALPPLRELGPHTVLPFVLLDRARTVLRSGALALDAIAAAMPGVRIEAVLDAGDSVQGTVTVPPLRGPRLDAAVRGAVEPMVLGDPDALAVGHGPRDEAGRVDVAWTDRAQLLRAWQLFADARLDVVGWIPLACLDETGNTVSPLRDATDARWQAASPGWSLADASLRPRGGGHAPWRRALAWSGVAAAVWILGLNVYAAQRSAEADRLRSDMRRQLASAFPDIPVIVDPVRQATQRRDTLRAAQGALTESDFLPLSLAATQAFDFAGDQILRLRYTAGTTSELRITPAAGLTVPPAARLARQAAAFGLLAAAADDGWVVRRGTAGAEQGGLQVRAGAGQGRSQ